MMLVPVQSIWLPNVDHMVYFYINDIIFGECNQCNIDLILLIYIFN